MASSKKRKLAEANGLDEAEGERTDPMTAAAEFSRRVIKKLQVVTTASTSMMHSPPLEKVALKVRFRRADFPMTLSRFTLKITPPATMAKRRHAHHQDKAKSLLMTYPTPASWAKQATVSRWTCMPAGTDYNQIIIDISNTEQVPKKVILELSIKHTNNDGCASF